MLAAPKMGVLTKANVRGRREKIVLGREGGVLGLSTKNLGVSKHTKESPIEKNF